MEGVELKKGERRMTVVYAGSRIGSKSRVFQAYMVYDTSELMLFKSKLRPYHQIGSQTVATIYSNENGEDQGMRGPYVSIEDKFDEREKIEDWSIIHRSITEEKKIKAANKQKHGDDIESHVEAMRKALRSHSSATKAKIAIYVYHRLIK